MHSAHVPHVCREFFAGDDILVVDGGNAAVWTSFYHSSRQPNTVLSTFKFGMLGAGVSQAIGAKVEVVGSESRQIEEVRGSSSYAAWHDLRLVFGLGDEDELEEAIVRWPDGEVQRIEAPATGQYHRLER